MRMKGIKQMGADMSKDNIIPFPKSGKPIKRTLGGVERLGKKYRVSEIERLRRYLKECDEDTTTILEQIDVLNRELLQLNHEYEVILKRIQKLYEIDN